MKKARIDKLGRVVIPIQYRKELGLNADSEMNIESFEKKVVITTADTLCRICGIKIEKNKELPYAKAVLSA